MSSSYLALRAAVTSQMVVLITALVLPQQVVQAVVLIIAFVLVFRQGILSNVASYAIIWRCLN